MPKKARQTLEQKRVCDRLQKQGKYSETKEDPEKYADLKAKEQHTLKEKNRKKISSAKDMTPRQLRVQRKK
ncbi:unnamed protein product [Parnassius apollo]|uniref:(apollo) hypothetical protein n=1 Tax=Parnassius apollo TaxID=110799 RepID=A0A8S3WSD9_PARAO|nr:unnamed protein product [Parnassius apollo]